MKTLIAATAIAIATSVTVASANQTSSTVGDSGTFDSECTFVAASDGVMSRDGDRWVTTTRGTFSVQIRGAISSLAVGTDNVLRTAAGVDTGVIATPDYTQDNGGLRSGAVAPEGTTTVTSTQIEVADIADSGVRNLFQLFIGGSVLMSKADGTDPKLGLVGSTDYKVNNTVTCTQ